MFMWGKRKHKREIRELRKEIKRLEERKSSLSLSVLSLQEKERDLIGSRDRLRKIDREVGAEIEKHRQLIKNDVSRNINYIIKSLIETKEFYDNHDYHYLKD